MSWVNSPWERSQSRAELKYFSSMSFYVESTLENFDRPNSDKVFIRSLGWGAESGRGDEGCLIPFLVVPLAVCSFLL